MIFALIVVAAIVAILWSWRGRAASSLETVEDRLNEDADAVRRRLAPDFAKAGVAYPPASIALLGWKDQRALQLYATNADGAFKFIRSYPVLAASGGPGPKLREGDRQVPEGLYEVESFNPNSRFHLALRVNYPNKFDRARAAEEGQRISAGIS